MLGFLPKQSYPICDHDKVQTKKLIRGLSDRIAVVVLKTIIKRTLLTPNNKTITQNVFSIITVLFRYIKINVTGLNLVCSNITMW